MFVPANELRSFGYFVFFSFFFRFFRFGFILPFPLRLPHFYSNTWSHEYVKHMIHSAVFSFLTWLISHFSNELWKIKRKSQKVDKANNKHCLHALGSILIRNNGNEDRGEMNTYVKHEWSRANRKISSINRRKNIREQKKWRDENGLTVCECSS